MKLNHAFYLLTTSNFSCMKSAVTSSEARLHIMAGGFWEHEVTAFFDVGVTHVNFKSNQSKEMSAVFKDQKDERKCKYQQRVLDVEMGTFAPLQITNISKFSP